MSGPAPGVGDRVLAKLEPSKHGFSARVIKVLESSPNNFIGVFNSQSDCGLVDPSDRRLKATFIINNKEINGASDGEILEVNQVCSYFCYSNRNITGLGVSLEGDKIGYYTK